MFTIYSCPGRPPEPGDQADQQQRGVAIPHRVQEPAPRHREPRHRRGLRHPLLRTGGNRYCRVNPRSVRSKHIVSRAVNVPSQSHSAQRRLLLGRFHN